VLLDLLNPTAMLPCLSMPMLGILGVPLGLRISYHRTPEAGPLDGFTE